jgi:hypothetical protein
MIHAHDAERDEFTIFKTANQNQTGTVGTSDNVGSDFGCMIGGRSQKASSVESPREISTMRVITFFTDVSFVPC